MPNFTRNTTTSTRQLGGRGTPCPPKLKRKKRRVDRAGNFRYQLPFIFVTMNESSAPHSFGGARVSRVRRPSNYRGPAGLGPAQSPRRGEEPSRPPSFIRALEVGLSRSSWRDGLGSKLNSSQPCGRGTDAALRMAPSLLRNRGGDPKLKFQVSEQYGK